MLYLLIAAIALTSASCYVIYSDRRKGWDKENIAVQLVAFLLAIIGCIGLIFVMVLGVDYEGAKHRAAIANREYGTDYTQAEMFYADGVINTVRELDRRRIEINGGFRRQRDPERNLPSRK